MADELGLLEPVKRLGNGPEHREDEKGGEEKIQSELRRGGKKKERYHHSLDPVMFSQALSRSFGRVICFRYMWTPKAVVLLCPFGGGERGRQPL